MPVVFSGVNDTSVQERLDADNITGVFEVKDVEANLELIRRFFPDNPSVVVVGDGSSTYRAIEQDITRLIADNQQDLAVQFRRLRGNSGA